MSVIRSRRLAGGNVVGGALTTVLTALANQTIVVDQLTGIANAGGPFDLWFVISIGAANVPGIVLPLRAVSNTGAVQCRFVLNPGDILQCQPLNGGPGWNYNFGVFGFSLTS